MNPLYIILERLTKKLELQADLDVVNKLLIAYFVNITGIAINLIFAILALTSGNTPLALFLFSSTAALILTFVIFHFTRQKFLSKILLTIITVIVFFYLLHTGGTEGSGHFWLLLFPAFSIPLFGIRRGNLVSFLFFVILVLYLVFQSRFDIVHPYSTAYSWRLICAYAVIHLMVYLNEYLRSHNYHVMERTIIEAKNETRQKDDFLSKLSHQIRTPLNNLTVVSNLGNKSKLDSEHRDLFDTILASTINLINLP